MPDSIDHDLIVLLAKDAQQSSQELAAKLNTSAATIRRRMKKLLDSDLLRIVGVVDPTKFGFPLIVIIIISAVPNKLDSLLDELVTRPEIQWVTTTTGRSDIVAIALFPSTDNLSNFLTKILGQMDGVLYSETLICLDVKKGGHTALIM